MTDPLDHARKLVSDAIIELENQSDALENEQHDSETEHDEWEDEPEDSRGDEPDVPDHQGEIDKINRTVNFLEKAVDELTED